MRRFGEIVFWLAFIASALIAAAAIFTALHARVDDPPAYATLSSAALKAGAILVGGFIVREVLRRLD